jgi:hypothetical protein
MTNLEVWQPVKGFENLYEISNLGNVKSLDRLVNGFNSKKLKKGKLLTQHNRNGYLGVVLSKEGYTKSFTVHRLVAIAFLPNDDFSLTVNHKDGNKHNNSIENLEWCTMSEQLKHAIKSGLFKPVSPRERGYVNTPEDYRKAAEKRKGQVVTEKTRLKIAKTLQKPIVCITDDIVFNSLNEAVEYSGVPKTTFHRNLKLNKLINGKYYKYKENKS